MNNDYKAYKANHSSMSSNKPIAKRILQKMNNSTFQQNSNNNRFIQGNRNPYINNENNSPEDIILMKEKNKDIKMKMAVKMTK